MLYSNFFLLQRCAERPMCPIIWRGEWGDLADFLYLEVGNRAVTFGNWLGVLRGERCSRYVYTIKILLDTDFTSSPLPSQPCGCSTVFIGCAQALPKRYKGRYLHLWPETYIHYYMPNYLCYRRVSLRVSNDDCSACISLG